MTDSNTQSPWLTLAEAVDELHAHESTVRRWADRGAIKTVRTPGGQRRFAREDVERIATEGYTADAGHADALLALWVALAVVVLLVAALPGQALAVVAGAALAGVLCAVVLLAVQVVTVLRSLDDHP